MITEIKIEGLDELIKEFSALGEGAVDKLSESTTEAAELVLQRAAYKINNRTGTLEQALKVVKPSKSRKNKYSIFSKVSFGKDGFYGVHLELGHRLVYYGTKTNKDVPEKPFLRPAADESKEEVADIMAKAMNKILDEWGD